MFDSRRSRLVCSLAKASGAQHMTSHEVPLLGPVFARVLMEPLKEHHFTTNFPFWGCKLRCIESKGQGPSAEAISTTHELPSDSLTEPTTQSPLRTAQNSA